MRRLSPSSLFPFAAGAWIGFLVCGPEVLRLDPSPPPSTTKAHPLRVPTGLGGVMRASLPAEAPFAKLPSRVREHLDFADRAPTSLFFPGDRRRDERREYHRNRLRRDPSSVEAHFDYAKYLASIDDFHGAGGAVLEVLRRVPHHERATALARILLRLHGAKTPLERMKARISLSELEVVAPGAAQPPATAEELARLDRDRQAVRAKYQGLLATPPYEPSREEQLRTGVPLRYEIDGAARQAEDAHLRLLTDFAASPLVRAEYVRFLLRQHRYADAQRVLASELRRFPAQLDLSIIQDHLRFAPDDESRSRVDDDVRYVLSLLATE